MSEKISQNVIGHPVGSQVVVTFQDDGILRIGEIVTVTSRPYVWKCGGKINGVFMSNRPDRDGMIVQESDRKWRNGAVAHPVAWLSPLADPDAVVVDQVAEVEA